MQLGREATNVAGHAGAPLSYTRCLRAVRHCGFRRRTSSLPPLWSPVSARPRAGLFSLGPWKRGTLATLSQPAETFTMDPTAFDLRGEHITLDALLKAAGLASSGGEAKQLIQQGGVLVNGEVDLRRGRKLRAGDEVAVGPRRVSVRTGT